MTEKDLMIQDLQEENRKLKEKIAKQRNVIIDGKYCFQSCACTEMCDKCARLGNGDTDYYEDMGEMEEKYNNGWIPCSERLPDESGTYIVNAIENSIVHVTFAKWMARMKRWNLSGSRSYWKITAWQPLPEPYNT